MYVTMELWQFILLLVGLVILTAMIVREYQTLQAIDKQVQRGAEQDE